MRLHPPSNLEATGLRDYQCDTVKATIAHMAEQPSARILICLATGLGKTRVATTLAKTVDARRVLWIAHREELIDQAEQAFTAVWPEAGRCGRITGGTNRPNGRIVLASIQSLYARRATILDQLADVDLVIVDEAHHTAARTYQEVLRTLQGSHGQLVDEPAPGTPTIIGLTATPDRADNAQIRGWYDRIAATYDTRWGIQNGYLCDLQTLTVQVAHLNLDTIERNNGDWKAGQLGGALQTACAPEAVRQAWQQHANGRPTISFAPTVQVAEEITQQFIDAGISAATLTGALPADQRRKITDDYRAGRVTVLSSVMVPTEGFDAPETSCVIVCRPTQSRSLFCFDDQTEALTPTGWVNGLDLDEGSIVAQWDPSTSEISWAETTAYIRRQLEPDEKMIGFASPSVDIRVTEGHRMIWRGRQRRNSLAEWRVRTAHELLRRSTEFEIPVAGNEKVGGVPLSDDELRLIAWIQTDGTVQSKTRAVTISQSYPENFESIESALNGCGIKWTVGVVPAGTVTNFGARNFDHRLYRCSFGKPRGTDKDLRGWGYLADWLPKWSGQDAWNLLAEMDERQFEIFLESWHLGDGSKQKNQSWTRRSYHLAISDVRTADWLQSMCVRRGWRANKSWSDTVWMLHCKKDVRRVIGGSNSTDRDHLRELTTVEGEEVWCVTVPTGALVVRRNGKASISGNCQMAGRGLRLAEGKDRCILLDVAGVSSKHRLVTASDVLGLHRALERHETAKDAIAIEAAAIQKTEEEAAEQAEKYEQLAEQSWQHGAARFIPADPWGRPAGCKQIWTHAPIDGCQDRWVCNRLDPVVVAVRRGKAGTKMWVAGVMKPGEPVEIIAEDRMIDKVTEAAEAFIEGRRPVGTAKFEAPTEKQLGTISRALGQPVDPTVINTKAVAGAMIGAIRSGRVEQARGIARKREQDQTRNALDELDPGRFRARLANEKRFMFRPKDVPGIIVRPVPQSIQQAFFDRVREVCAQMVQEGVLREQNDGWVIVANVPVDTTERPTCDRCTKRHPTSHPCNPRDEQKDQAA